MRRHDLFHLLPAGWAALLDLPWDVEAQACLRHWRDHDLPLVVSRQACVAAPDAIALGLPAPACWSRRRLALQLPAAQLGRAARLPGLDAVVALLDPAERPAGHRLADALAGASASVRVAGSYGWQRLTGLDYLRPGSDLDLLVEVADAASARAAADLLSAWDGRGAGPGTGTRLDGELIFPSGGAVAWREWSAAEQVLVKRLGGVALEPRAALA